MGKSPVCGKPHRWQSAQDKKRKKPAVFDNVRQCKLNGAIGEKDMRITPFDVGRYETNQKTLALSRKCFSINLDKISYNFVAFLNR